MDEVLKQITFPNKSLERIADSLSPSFDIEVNDLRRQAMQWSISHGSFSGRTARQFIDSPEGRLRKKKWKKK